MPMIILLNTGRGIGTETYVLETMFPLNNSKLVQVLKAVDLRYHI